MSYNIEEIKQGIKLHYIKTDKFKTNLLSVFLTIPLAKETVTANAVIPAILRRGTAKLKSQELISTELENTYGATFDCGVEKTGDNQILKFYLEMVNDEFLPNQKQMLEQGIDLLLDIVFNPLIEDGKFKDEYVRNEKENMRKIIEAKIDNKDRYAFDRCIEEMYKNTIYGLYKYGYIEDLAKLNNEEIYNKYKELIKKAKIDIFVSGNIEKERIIKNIKQNKNIEKLDPREDIHVISSEQTRKNHKDKPNAIEEKMDVTQGKLVIGTDVEYRGESNKYKTSVYNVILGESATSKLFQNVRERESLAYTARSNYIRQKNNIYIMCGIEIQNYEKAIAVIKEQLEDMKKGKFDEKDIENAKKYIVSGLRTTREEQDSEISYCFGQEISGEHTTFEEYEKQINKVTKKDIEDVANSIKINTIYFLRN